MTKPLLTALVDDDESIRHAVRDLLESAGLSSVSFKSSEEYLSSPHRSDFTCIVLDIKLPGMNGLDLQKHLIHSGESAMVIFLTAVDDPYAQERAMKFGAKAFLYKPVDGTRLLHWIERCLESAPDKGPS